jgi:hypothetical protein
VLVFLLLKDFERGYLFYCHPELACPELAEGKGIKRVLIKYFDKLSMTHLK